MKNKTNSINVEFEPQARPFKIPLKSIRIGVLYSTHDAGAKDPTLSPGSHDVAPTGKYVLHLSRPPVPYQTAPVVPNSDSDKIVLVGIEDLSSW